jgi:hypothetical protein
LSIGSVGGDPNNPIRFGFPSFARKNPCGDPGEVDPIIRFLKPEIFSLLQRS